uniref:Uncharacterized protein n=1 Tax=Macrostomum lignano TaxID=282301 RepID=A0A1I8HU07_9PLAT
MTSQERSPVSRLHG